MTFARIRGAGFAANTKLASTEMTALDIDHANALDKTTAGDTLAGVVQFSGNAQINANTNGGAANSFSGAISATFPASIQSNTSQAILSNAAAGITSTVASGITASVAGGIDGNATSGIRASVVSGITTNIAGGITSGVAGGINLTGGAADWPTFSATRNRTVVRQMLPFGTLSTGWTSSLNGSLLGPATSAVQQCMLPVMHDAAKINWVEFRFAVPTSHLPVIFPNFVLIQTDTTTGAGLGGTQIFNVNLPTPGTGAAWTSGGTIQAFRVTVGSPPTVDISKYIYTLLITDEQSGGSVAGNQFLAVAINYTTIADMRWSA